MSSIFVLNNRNKLNTVSILLMMKEIKLLEGLLLFFFVFCFFVITCKVCLNAGIALPETFLVMLKGNSRTYKGRRS
jgi:hypothetical protein